MLVNVTLPHTMQSLNDLNKELFENIVRKRENSGHQYFLLCPQYFILFPKLISFFSVARILLSPNGFNLDQTENFSCGKKLKHYNLGPTNSSLW